MLTLLEARQVLAGHHRVWWRRLLHAPGACRTCGAGWLCPPVVEARQVVHDFETVPLPPEWRIR